MDKVTIDGTEYKVNPKIVELLLLISKERDQLKYFLKIAGYECDKVPDMYSGELFRDREYLNEC